MPERGSTCRPRHKPAPTSTSSITRRGTLIARTCPAPRAGAASSRHPVEHDAGDLLDHVDLAGHVACPPRRYGDAPVVVDAKTEPLEDASLLVGWHLEAEHRSARSAGADEPPGSRGSPAWTSTAPVISAPARSTMRRLASSAAGSARCGSTPFSHRFDPSVRNASRSDVRRTPIGSKFAASSSTSVVSSETSDLEPTHDRGERDSLSPSVISRSSGRRRLVAPSSVRQPPLPRRLGAPRSGHSPAEHGRTRVTGCPTRASRSS